MTRLLSRLLDALEPDFRLNIQELEKAAGHPNADIRLTSQLIVDLRAKLVELGFTFPQVSFQLLRIVISFSMCRLLS